MSGRREFALHVLANTVGSLAAAAIIYLLAVALGYVRGVNWGVVLSGAVVGFLVVGAIVGLAMEFVKSIYEDIAKGVQALRSMRNHRRNRGGDA